MEPKTKSCGRRSSPLSPDRNPKLSLFDATSIPLSLSSLFLFEEDWLHALSLVSSSQPVIISLFFTFLYLWISSCLQHVVYLVST